ncbi:hypothetical protein BU15DRAFT_59457 [Melanogaster broomeanus]|nr:hypothetical protein BU15DRAFT_59457 [Melanogaster broomeanus]
MSFVLDRFILSANTVTVISLWDVPEHPSSTIVPSYPCARLSLPSWELVAHNVSSDNSTLYVAVTKHHRARIYAVPLGLVSNVPPSGNKDRLSFNLTADFSMPIPDTIVIRSIDPDSSLVLLCQIATSIVVLNWRTNFQATITMQSDDLEEVWNGVTALRLCGPYILCFRIHSVEAYPLPTGFSEPGTTSPSPGSLSVLRHEFPAVVFRRVSLSQVRSSRCPSGEVYTIFMLANDLHRGTYHYQINVTTAPVPSISVKLLAMRDIGISTPLISTGDNIGAPQLSVMIRGTFVSAWALGSVGLRSVWVERQRGSIDRRVVASTTYPSRLHSKEPSSRREPRMNRLRSLRHASMGEWFWSSHHLTYVVGAASSTPYASW